jgi:hypothetical protein
VVQRRKEGTRTLKKHVQHEEVVHAGDGLEGVRGKKRGRGCYRYQQIMGRVLRRGLERG